MDGAVEWSSASVSFLSFLCFVCLLPFLHLYSSLFSFSNANDDSDLGLGGEVGCTHVIVWALDANAAIVGKAGHY